MNFDHAASPPSARHERNQSTRRRPKQIRWSRRLLRAHEPRQRRQFHRVCVRRLRQCHWLHKKRHHTVPGKCRFLQGATQIERLSDGWKMPIENRKESVELLLNYEKNKEPFWNLLYAVPLYNEIAMSHSSLAVRSAAQLQSTTPPTSFAFCHIQTTSRTSKSRSSN